MSDPKTIAKALMRGNLPSREIAGLIYDEADVENPVAMQTPPPIENVEKAAKKSWVKAATAVMSKVPEYSGRMVIGHKSKNLKRIYIEHGEDQETLQQLHGLVGNGYTTGEAWAKKIDIEWLKTWSNGRELHWQTIETVARRLMVEKHYETITKWRHKTEDARMAFLGGAVGYGIEQNDTAAVEALLENLKTAKARINAIWAGWESSGGCVNETTLHLFKQYYKNPKDLAERMQDAGCFAEPTNEDNYAALLELLPAGGGSAVVEGDIAERYIQITLRYAGYDTIKGIIDSRIEAACEDSYFSSARTANDRDRDHAMIEACLETLARFEAGEDTEEIEGIFDQYPRPFSAEATYQALRFGSANTTWTWFGDEVHVPDTETFHRLLQNPGRGLPVKRDGSIDWAVFHAEAGATNVGTLFKLPFVQELLEAMGRYGTEMLLDEAAWEAQSGSSESALASEYLAQKFTEHLGRDLEAWRGAIRVLATSTQPLGRTLRGVAKLYGNPHTA